LNDHHDGIAVTPEQPARAADRIFLKLGPNTRLGADEHQWILYRAGQPVSYVRSTKAILVSGIREKGIKPSAEGKACDRTLSTHRAHFRSIAVPRPVPAAGQVLIRVQASGLNPLAHLGR
jgi:hypothetical protein